MSAPILNKTTALNITSSNYIDYNSYIHSTVSKAGDEQSVTVIQKKQFQHELYYNAVNKIVQYIKNNHTSRIMSYKD